MTGGSEVTTGGLVSAGRTLLTVLLGLVRFSASWPNAVNGRRCSGFPSSGMALEPSGWIPRSPGSQVPEMSWRGAGADLSITGVAIGRPQPSTSTDSAAGAAVLPVLVLCACDLVSP